MTTRSKDNRSAFFQGEYTMRISRVIAAFALPLALSLPVATFAQSGGAPAAAPAGGGMASKVSPEQMQTAVKSSLKSVNLTMRQKMQIKPMIENYQSQTAGADAATKKSAQENLLKGIYGILTPPQQAQFKSSMKASLASAMMSSQ